MKRIYIFTILFLIAISFKLQKINTVSLPAKIYAGQVHYSRIPIQYWEHRILTIKSMGLNALSVYVMWNYHENQKGGFDFQTGNKNLKQFLSLAKKHDMYVLIRPGPYVCAQWDFGGLPSRLLAIQGLVIRSNNNLFLAEVTTYFKALSPILKPFLATVGGPIILLQIENEFGFWGQDMKYIEALRNIWSSLSFKVDEYYVDISANLAKCHWAGANIGVNGATNQSAYDYARSIQRKGFIFGGEIYSGWLTHWREDHWQNKSITNVKKQYQFLLGYNHSFSMYMVHGGTNFGLTAGANSYKNEKYDYRGHITSYDYDAPINEQGSPTDKFFMMKELLADYITWDVPHVPQPIPMIQIPSFQPPLYAYLFDTLTQPWLRNVEKLPVFQSSLLNMYNQGMVLYQTTLDPKTYYMKLTVHDYALVYLNQQLIYTLDRSESSTHQIVVQCKKTSNFRILVEAMGHINFDHEMTKDFKGIISLTDDAKTVFLWKLYRINVDKKVINTDTIDQSTNQKYSTEIKEQSSSPAVFRAEFNITSTGDTYFNMSNFVKGYVWVNGVNLGRYWNVGPEMKLFCPGVWLRNGKNQIMVMDLHLPQSASLSGDKTRT